MYENLVRDHFERCLDLYMCPRMTRKKMNIADPNMLIPELPSPSDLKPFPNTLSIDFKFHKSCVRSISVSKCGRYLASGDQEGNLLIWNIRTTKILRKYKLENDVIDSIEWCPSETNCLLSVSNEEQVYVIQPMLYSQHSNSQTKVNMEEWQRQYNIDKKASDQKEKFVKWEFLNDDCKGALMIKMKFHHVISKIAWHSKGDYFSTMAHNIQTSSQVMIHSLSRTSSTRPFT